MLNQIKTMILGGAIVLSLVSQSDAMQNKGCDSACTQSPTRHFGFIAPGVSWIDADKLNDFLATQGISSFKDVAPTLSLGGSKEYRRLIFESNLTMRYWHERVNSNVRTSLFMGDMMWNTGYNLLPPSFMTRVFPYAGIGFGINSIYLRNDTATFADMRSSQNTNSMLWKAKFLINAGLGTDLILTKDKSGPGLVMGLRAGYLYDPFNHNKSWYSSGTEIKGMPDLRQSGAYIKLILGGWGHHKKEAR